MTPAELEKILIQDRLQQAESLTNTMNRARMLGRYAVYFHDPNLINTTLANYSEVTSTDIRRVARMYMGETQRTVVLTTPKAQAQEAPAH